MASIASLLKDEITRLARREVRRQTEPFKRASAAHRRHIASLKRQIASLQKQLRSASRGRSAAAANADAGDATTRLRFSVKGLKTMRAKLGLSAAQFGKLIGVSGQSVYNWESEKAVPRRSQIAAIAALRGVGKREVMARLEGDAGTKPRRARTSKAAARAPRKAGRPAGKATRKAKPAARKPRAAKQAPDAD